MKKKQITLIEPVSDKLDEIAEVRLAALNQTYTRQGIIAELIVVAHKKEVKQ